MDEEKKYLLFFSCFPKIGPLRLRLLIKFFGSPAKVWNASKRELLKVNLSQKLVDEFFVFKKNFDPNSYFVRLKKIGIKVITYEEKDYPENLKKIKDPPIVIYYKGELESIENPILAVVGARKMTSYGKDVCEYFVEELAKKGVVIVSGLALGVDTQAHRTALKMGGKTVAVLGSGLEMIYPRANYSLAEKIVEKKGAVITEYPLDYPALPENFPARNRIISGISLGVLIIEGARNSGTLLTAMHAASQGREVFAVPGPIDSLTSWTPHFLIKNGAKLVSSIEDILEEIDLNIKIEERKVREIVPQDEKEEKILQALEEGPTHLDEIVRITKIKVSQISEKLTFLELKGMVKNLGGGVYKRV